MKSTRTFSFPNGGHSVRKLRASLLELEIANPGCLCQLTVIPSQYVEIDDVDVCYTVSTYGTSPLALVDALDLLGVTRFTYNFDTNSLDYYTLDE